MFKEATLLDNNFLPIRSLKILKNVKKMMKTYLEIQVPIQYSDYWFESLRNELHSIPVIWQKGFYHITMAFIDDTPEHVDLKPILDKYFKESSAIELTFDKIDAFTATSEMQIIYLTATQVPASFLSMIEAIRNDLDRVGCKIQSNFRLHVTLGRVKSPDVKLAHICELIDKVSIPKFTLKLTDVDYRVFRGTTLYETKLINNQKNSVL